MDKRPVSVTLHEIETLKARARWYRNWAEVAGNEDERQSRIRLAEYIEGKARAAEQTEPDSALGGDQQA